MFGAFPTWKLSVLCRKALKIYEPVPKGGLGNTAPVLAGTIFSLPHCSDQYQTYLKLNTWMKSWRLVQLPKAPQFCFILNLKALIWQKSAPLHFHMLRTAKGNLVSDFSSKCPTLPKHILAQISEFLTLFCFILSKAIHLQPSACFDLFSWMLADHFASGPVVFTTQNAKTTASTKRHLLNPFCKLVY